MVNAEAAKMGQNGLILALARQLLYNISAETKPNLEIDMNSDTWVILMICTSDAGSEYGSVYQTCDDFESALKDLRRVVLACPDERFALMPLSAAYDLALES